MTPSDDIKEGKTKKKKAKAGAKTKGSPFNDASANRLGVTADQSMTGTNPHSFVLQQGVQETQGQAHIDMLESIDSYKDKNEKPAMPKINFSMKGNVPYLDTNKVN